MQAQVDSDRLSIRTNLISTDRPDSSQLVDLHVYIIPKTVWKDRQNLAENEAIEQAISGGFVRVPPNLTVQDLRQQIMNVCGQDEEFPKEFVYLRSVGRCLTKVKPQQETELRVKNYRPPITFAPEIYILEGQHDEEGPATPDSKKFLYRESPIRQTMASPPNIISSRPQSFAKPVATGPPLELPSYPTFVQSGERQNSNSFIGIHNTSLSNLSIASTTLSTREIAKLREEQERLRVRQNELARQRREMEQEQQRRAKELQENPLNHSRQHGEKEEAAAIQIQTAYRSYRTRRLTADGQKQRQQAANEIERLQKEAREFTRRKAEEEHAEEAQAHDVAQLSDRLEDLKSKRTELEAARESIVRQMQQFHAQIAVRRKEERDTWKQKYLTEKKKTSQLQEQNQLKPKGGDVQVQIEQAKHRLNNYIKLREEAEDECQHLKQQLHNIRSSLKSIERTSVPRLPPPLANQPLPPPLPKQPLPPPISKQSFPPPSQHQPATIPINLDITLQY